MFKPKENGLWKLKINFNASDLPAAAGDSIGRHLAASATEGESGAIFLAAARHLGTSAPLHRPLEDVGAIFVQVHDHDRFARHFDQAFETTGSVDDALASCLWGRNAQDPSELFKLRIEEDYAPEARVEALPEGRLKFVIDFDIDIATYREHFDEGFSIASMRRNVLCHDSVEEDAGFRIRSLKIERKGHDAKAILDVEVFDGRALAAVAADARREAWLEDGWKPETVGDAFAELLFASNSSASPDEYGAAYGDWREEWIGEQRAPRVLPPAASEGPEPGF